MFEALGVLEVKFLVNRNSWFHTIPLIAIVFFWICKDDLDGVIVSIYTYLYCIYIYVLYVIYIYHIYNIYTVCFHIYTYLTYTVIFVLSFVAGVTTTWLYHDSWWRTIGWSTKPRTLLVASQTRMAQARSNRKQHLSPRKLPYPLKIDGWKMKIPL